MPSNGTTKHMAGLRGPAYKKGKYVQPHHSSTVKPSVGRKPAERYPGHSASRAK